MQEKGGEKHENRPGRRSKADVIAATVLLIFSAAYTLSSLGLKIGRLSSPGPGLMPLLLGIGLTACALAYLAQQVRRRRGSREPLTPKVNAAKWSVHGTPLGIVVAVAAYPFLLSWLGFLVSTSLVVCAMLLLLRFRGPGVSILVGIVMTFLCYLLFARVLGVVLPAGPVEVFLFKWF